MNLYTFTNFILCFKFNQIKLFLLFFSFSLTLNSQSTSRDDFFIKSSEQFYSSKYSKNGAQRIDMYKDLIKNKNVGLVVNQTSVINILNSDNIFQKHVHLVDTLMNLDFVINKIFSPEHGFKGSADAGAYVKDGKYRNIPIVSLYGNKKKPTSEDLQGIEIMIFDIQDVGVRFYTYISTLHYIMEACAENNIPLIVLDRYNPNRSYVDGPVLKSEYKSFVGMHPVPIVYGMTIGEYALMINGEKWLKNNLQCDLNIIEIQNLDTETQDSVLVTYVITGFSHGDLTNALGNGLPEADYDTVVGTYAISDTDLVYYNGGHEFVEIIKIEPLFMFEKKLRIPPSPNLPNYLAISFYPSLCLFEGTSVSVGRGTGKPFQHFGSPYFPKSDYMFVPKPTYGANLPKHINRICYGYSTEKLIDKFNKKGNLLILDWLIESYNITSDKEEFFNSFFDKLAGSSELKQQIKSGYSENQIRESWQKDLISFKKIRSKYTLYD